MNSAVAEDGLPPLRQVIEEHGLAAKKSLGQNFLFDLNLTRRIARAAGALENATVVEIGPGPGGLTRALLFEGAKKVIAVERDARAIPALKQIAAHYPDRLQIVEADALEVDWASLVSGPTQIVANLPYNIGTPLLLGWLTQEHWPPFYQSLTLMFQKEVAQRIAASPGTSQYGRLSVISQWRCHCKKLFDVNRSAFTPPPKITSSIVQLVPKTPAINCKVNALECVTASAFGQRRKMLRSSLGTVFEHPEDALEKVSITPTKRAEELSVEDFARLAQLLD
jgi:16S rRNA (adenine1518-N6/adenine1519-N6)-dimethyltransferase